MKSIIILFLAMVSTVDAYDEKNFVSAEQERNFDLIVKLAFNRKGRVDIKCVARHLLAVIASGARYGELKIALAKLIAWERDAIKRYMLTLFSAIEREQLDAAFHMTPEALYVLFENSSPTCPTAEELRLERVRHNSVSE